MPPAGELTAAFLPYCAPSSPAHHMADLEVELRERDSAGRAAWPTVQLDAATFMRHIAERSAENLPPVALAGDIYIACACTHGVATAIEAFHRAFRGDIGRAISKTDSSHGFLDELMQVMNVKLFVRTGEASPTIAEYSGRASLRGWVATVAKRAALNLRRAKADREHDQVTSGIRQLGTAAGPEMALLKARYKAEFEQSIRAALAKLSDKERTLLLLHLVNGLTLPQLAAMQNVSRATIARWLATARETLFATTRQELVGRLRVSPSEYESILALVRSQLDLSIVQVFADRPVG